MESVSGGKQRKQCLRDEAISSGANCINGSRLCVRLLLTTQREVIAPTYRSCRMYGRMCACCKPASYRSDFRTGHSGWEAKLELQR